MLYEGNKEDGRKTLECGAEINNGRTGQTVFFNPIEKFVDRKDSFKSSKTSMNIKILLQLCCCLNSKLFHYLQARLNGYINKLQNNKRCLRKFILTLKSFI